VVGFILTVAKSLCAIDRLEISTRVEMEKVTVRKVVRWKCSQILSNSRLEREAPK
jgi:hypothetical protein